MTIRGVPQKVLDDAVKAVAEAGGNQTEAARKLGIPRTTLHSRLESYQAGRSKEALVKAAPAFDDYVRELAELLRQYPDLSEMRYRLLTRMPEKTLYSHRGGWSKFKSAAMAIMGTVDTEGAVGAGEIYELKDRVRMLTTQLAGIQREQLTDKHVREKIIGLREAELSVPNWVLKPRSSNETVSVPTLFCSDWHWGEVVDPDQVDGVNEFNLAIAHDRVKRLASHTIDLLRNHMGKMRYEGIVLALGGDMVSGDIHEDLVANNEMEIMPTVLDVWGALVWLIEKMADEFGQVFVPCVTGNHGRSTKFVRAKGRNYTSYDWLTYSFLEKHFEAKKDARVKFMVSPAADCLYQVYGHRYLLTHGDQTRGGDGIIGPLGPLTRGNKKKAARNVAINRSYDTMLVGHWHTYMSLMKLIVNGAIKGYDEYGYVNNFDYEPPQQALWLTHPTRGITISAPVQVDPVQHAKRDTAWIRWAA